jgi:alpha,alpha-trehalose phosphorylase
VIAAEVGHLGLAFDYLGEAALMDLEDLESNTTDGLHIASLAGAWLALVAGFAGMRTEGGRVSFAPRMPEGLTRLAFSLLIRGQRLRVEITHARARYLLFAEEGKPLEIAHHGVPVTLSPGKPEERPVPATAPRPRPRQPPGREPARRTATGLAEGAPR